MIENLFMKAWKPFHKLLKIFHTSYDVRTSVIDLFATFFLLVMSVTTDLLIPTQIDKLGSNGSTFGMYYSFILLLARKIAMISKIEQIAMTISGVIFAFIPLFYTFIFIISGLVTSFKTDTSQRLS